MNRHYMILTGLIMGLAIGVPISGMLEAYKLPSDLWAFTGSFVGAILTVYAAFAVANNQTRIRREEEAASLERRRLASRAVLANDISQTISYTKACARACLEAFTNASNNARTPVEIPEFDTSILLRFERTAELLEPSDARAVIGLMHALQVQRARLTSSLKEYNDQLDRDHIRLTTFFFDDTFQSTIEMFLRSESMFNFARLTDEHIQPKPLADADGMRALSQLGLREFYEDREENILAMELRIVGRLDITSPS